MTGAPARETFDGFSDRALELYVGLEADNSREFWATHKTVYEAEVREPMLALLDALEEEFGAGKLFRPHRDVRFAKDKSPYKTHQGAFVGATLGIGYYLQVDKDGLLAGGGWRSHGTDQVRRFREAVDSEPAGGQLVGIVAELRGSGFAVVGDELKTAPRGYPADHPRIELLRCRSLMVTRRFGAPDWLASPRALDEVRATWRAVTPLNTWVTAHVDTG